MRAKQNMKKHLLHFVNQNQKIFSQLSFFQFNFDAFESFRLFSLENISKLHCEYLFQCLFLSGKKLIRSPEQDCQQLKEPNKNRLFQLLTALYNNFDEIFTHLRTNIEKEVYNEVCLYFGLGNSPILSNATKLN